MEPCHGNQYSDLFFTKRRVFLLFCFFFFEVLRSVQIRPRMASKDLKNHPQQLSLTRFHPTWPVSQIG